MNQNKDLSAIAYRRIRQQHWDKISGKRDSFLDWGFTYHNRIEKIYKFIVPPDSSIIEIGCGEGDLLASLRPSLGVGIDFSAKTIELAKIKHPNLQFLQLDAHDLHSVEGHFDFVIISDTINDLWDVQEALQQVKRLCTPRTRIIANYYSHLWQVPLTLAQGLGMAKKMLPQNWLTNEDIAGLATLAGLETIRQWQEILFPFPIPFMAQLFNRFLVHLWGFRFFALTNFMIARLPIPNRELIPTVSVVVPARNEAGNIPALFERLPDMGSDTELILVEGHSSDSTYEIIEREINKHPNRKCKLFRQKGTGKADAVSLGFTEASGDILMILDADLTVPPENLPRFYDVLISRKGEFVNGVRLVYPMEHEAMRMLNLVGNKFFSLAFSWLLSQPIKDTLCGTKVLWKIDYENILKNRNIFGDFDPFGDFELLFGAAKLNLKIVDLPIRYRDRTYGYTNISRWKHGWLLLRMVWYAAIKLKFI
jgi:SAM-dependent methyltransferase